MIIPFTLLFGAIGYLYYKSKDEVSLVKEEKLDSPSNQLDQDDLYKDLEDLFISVSYTHLTLPTNREV